MQIRIDPCDHERAAQATFLFADLCGYTEYTCLYGDERATELATAFHRLVRELAAEAVHDAQQLIT